MSDETSGTGGAGPDQELPEERAELEGGPVSEGREGQAKPPVGEPPVEGDVRDAPAPEGPECPEEVDGGPGEPGEREAEGDDEGEASPDDEGDVPDDQASDSSDAAAVDAAEKPEKKDHTLLIALALIVVAALAIFALSPKPGSDGDAGQAEEEEVDPRTQVLEDYVEERAEDLGWEESEITYEDHEEDNVVLVYLKPASGATSHDHYDYNEQMLQEDANGLAGMLDCVVYIFGYTSDEYLVVTAGGFPADVNSYGDEKTRTINDYVFDEIGESQEYAERNREEWIQRYNQNLLTSGDYDWAIQAKAMESDDGNVGVAFIVSPGSLDEVDQEFDDSWQWEADYLTQVLGTNVVVIFYTPDGEVARAYPSNYADNMIVGFRPSEMQQ